MWYNGQVNESWPLSQTVKTSPSHGEDMGSIPVGVTTGSFKDEAANLFRAISSAGRAPGSQSGGQGFDPPMVHQRSTPPPRRWGASLVDRVVLWRENPLRRSGSKRADCHDCTAPVREPTDTRRNECAVGTLKKFANLSPHISVQIPLRSTSRQCLHPLPDRKKAEPSRVPRREGSDCFLWILFEKTWFYPVFALFWHFGTVTKKSRNADIFRILVGRELMSSDF